MSTAHDTDCRETAPRLWLRRIAGVSVAFAFVAAAFTLLGVPLPSAWSAGRAAPVLPDGLGPLSAVPVPLPSNLGNYVTDSAAATRLGKALFWDMQAGSDGKTACASCHFAAGTDNRTRNTLAPGGPGSGATAFTGTLGINKLLTAADFPLGQAVAGSQGVVPSTFNRIDFNADGSANEITTPPATVDPVFSDGSTNVRRVTARRTPSVINAVFNDRNFWDGRARNHFNGVNPAGELDPNAKVAQSVAGVVSLVAIPLTDLNNASLASQAVGPPDNTVEMSADGRTLRDIGKKLLNLQPLGKQAVASTDSLLGGTLTNGQGLTQSYQSLVEQAFNPKWWSAPDFKLDANGVAIPAPGTSPNAALPSGEYSLMQYNWPLIWGLAINLYEATLVSDQTPFDRWASGADPTALTPQEIAGLDVFTSAQGSCSGCHSGAEMTQAALSNVTDIGTIDSDGQGRRFDTGFMNVGVRPQAEDLGNGAGPWSDTKRGATPCTQPIDCIVDGSFKTPGLRNVDLQAPYFHTGSQLTLDQVVDFYNRGGDFANPNKHREVGVLGLSLTQRVNLASFMRALTDPRVETQSAPFDHPQLLVPNGHQTPLSGGLAGAADATVEIPATGAAGGAPLPRFLPQPPLTLPPAPITPPVVTPPVVTPPVVTPPVVTPPVVTPSVVTSPVITSETTPLEVRPPSVAVRLAVTKLFVKVRVKQSSLRSKGLVVTLNVPAGATTVRLRLVRLVRSSVGAKRVVEKVVIAKFDRKVSGPGAIQITVPARLMRNLPIGQYVLRARTGAVVSDLGPISARRFSIVR